MKVLILGVEGMLGHKLYQVFQENFNTFGTMQGNVEDYAKYNLFDEKTILSNVNAFDIASIKDALNQIHPNVVVNCIGIIKQLKEAKNPEISIAINSLFPHQLAKLSSRYNFRLFHISTDCVFSGRKGNYKEEDISDAEDLYGRTKYLGEVGYGNCLTLRTSIIGRELNTSNGLLEWILPQNGKKIQGYTNAIYTGFTTNFFAAELKKIILQHPKLSGLFHLSSNPISKFDLLQIIKKQFHLEFKIESYNAFYCDRSLDSTKYRIKTGFVPPSWEKMIEQLCLDKTPYFQWRKR
ncbi:MAG: SDR family oxidoreductase [Candidatus Aminicenantes bacterium]|nr:SDR family oxidoreductase [Candidatus Aminicenantes bacterium]